MPGRGRGRKDSGSDLGTDEGQTVGTFETLRDEGEHFVHVKQYQRAIESFTKALEMKAGDKTCLVTRAKCHLMLGNFSAALTDAEKALEDEEEGKGKDIREYYPPKSTVLLQALCMKAEALYMKGDFEAALVFYHRGNKLRPELTEFRLGIQKCQEAINNSIGTPDAIELNASGDLSFFYKQEEKKAAAAKGGTYSKPGQQKKEEKKDRTKPQDGGSNKTTKQLLGELYSDKAFLDKLYDSMITGQDDTSQADRYIKDRTVDGLEYLNRRADFWRQQKPMYARERDRKRQRQQMSATRSGSGDPMQWILHRLEEIDEAQADGKYEQSLKKSQKTLEKVESWGDDRINNKPALVANLYSCMGNAYLEMGKYKEAIDYHNKDLDIGKEKEIDEAESRALDNLGRTKARMGKYDDAIKIWEQKLPKSKSPLESTWLYHEIGRCHLEIGQNSDAKDYGEKSLAAAQEADDRGWQLHATVLIAQAEVKCEELQAAADSFSRAQEIAEDLEDTSAQSAIKKALEEVNSRIVKGVQDGDEKDRDDGDETEGSKDKHDQGQHRGQGQIKDKDDHEDRGKHKGQTKEVRVEEGQFDDKDDDDDKRKDKGQAKEKDDKGKHKGQTKDKDDDKNKGQTKDKDDDKGQSKDKEDHGKHEDQGKHKGQTKVKDDDDDKDQKKKDKKETTVKAEQTRPASSSKDPPKAEDKEQREATPQAEEGTKESNEQAAVEDKPEQSQEKPEEGETQAENTDAKGGVENRLSQRLAEQ